MSKAQASKKAEEKYMRKALNLAARGLGRTRPNPAVGAVIVKQGRIIGQGYHRLCGGPHAEAAALQNTSASARGADIYVTLEPCGHEGRTPPCAAALIKAGIKRVFYGCPDPNPKTAGKGPALLKKAGVTVTHGPLREEAAHFNAPYTTWMQNHIPLVTAKWAMTLDGKIATHTGASRWITGEAARKIAHKLRHSADAIMAGTTTFLRDDPLLTCRVRGGITPVRIVLDRQLRLPLDRRVFHSVEAGPVILYTATDKPKKRKALEKMGVAIHRIRQRDRGLDLKAILKDLGRRDIQHLLIEGGGALLGRCFDLDLVQRVVVFMAPKLIGGQGAVTPVAGQGATDMTQALPLRITRRRQAGGDLVLWGDVQPVTQDN